MLVVVNMILRDPGKLFKVFLLTLIQLRFCVKGSSSNWRSPWMETSYSCQGERLNLSCPQNLVIKVMRANYGRFSLTVCNPGGVTDWSVNCMAPRSLRIVQERCDGMSECALESRLEGVTDPCPGTEKYLEAHYICHSLEQGPPTQETTTTTSTTANPLPPWLTTRSTLPNLLDLLDLGITPPSSSSSGGSPTSSPTPSTSTRAAADPTSSSSMRSVDPSTAEEAEAETTTVEDVEKSSSVENEILPVQQTLENKVEYTLDTNNTHGVRVILSTLPPPPPSSARTTLKTTPGRRYYRPHPTTAYTPSTPPLLSKHTGELAATSMCPPRLSRSLSWPWTSPGTMSMLSCPPGSSGVARWSCGLSSTGGLPTWIDFTPDLSECESAWMTNILAELRKSDSIGMISRDLVEYVAVNPLYGGDIIAIVTAVTIITEKMDYQVSRIPTIEQREALAMEVAQSIAKVISLILEVDNIPAWQDLPHRLRMKFVVNLIGTLERFTIVLPRTVPSDKEVSISSPNLLLVLKKMSFPNIRGTHIPSPAALATRDWSDYVDRVDIPALVLMENMGGEGSHVSFISTRNLDLLLTPHHYVGSSAANYNNNGQVVNSQVVHVSLGEPRPTLREPVTLLFRHLSKGNLSQPQCVHWDALTGSWSGSRCSLQFSNSTHSQCECSVLGTLAVLETIKVEDSMHRVTMVVILIVSVTVTIISAISLGLIILYCKRVKVQDEWKLRLAQARFPWCQRKPDNSLNFDSSLYTGRLGSPTFLTSAHNVFSDSDFMVLSQSSLNEEIGLDPRHLHHLQPGSRPQQHQPHHTPDPRGVRQYTGMSVAGPQVETVLRAKPNHQEDRAAVAVPPRCSTVHHQHQYSGVEENGGGGVSSHIYMEVDPLYTAYLPHSHTQIEFLSSPSVEDLHASTPGIVSSNSSHSSSGYSTAPSEYYSYSNPPPTGMLLHNMKGVGVSKGLLVSGVQRGSPDQLTFTQPQSSHTFITKDQVF